VTVKGAIHKKNCCFNALTNSKLLDEYVVALKAVALQVLEQLATVLHHLHQPTIVVAIFSVQL